MVNTKLHLCGSVISSSLLVNFCLSSSIFGSSMEGIEGNFLPLSTRPLIFPLPSKECLTSFSKGFLLASLAHFCQTHPNLLFFPHYPYNGVRYEVDNVLYCMCVDSQSDFPPWFQITDTVWVQVTEYLLKQKLF